MQEEKEIWRDIPGYEGLYQASNFGRIKSLPKYHTNGKDGRKYLTKEKIMTPSFLRRGYLGVVLSKHGSHKTISVHRLIAMSFLPMEQGRTQVNHKDGVKTNNHIENLEWCNQAENNRHARYVLKRKINGCKRIGGWRYNSRKTVQKSQDGQVIAVFDCIADAARATKTSTTNIRSVMIGKTKTARGFKWEYVSQ